MFESVDTLDCEGIPDEPRPGDATYDSFQRYQAQQEAFWSAVGRGEIPVIDGFPQLAAARTDEGLLEAARRAERNAAAAEGAKLRAIAVVLRRMASPEVGYDADAMMHSAQAEVGLRLRMPAWEASDLTHLALYLARRLPRTFAMLEAGDISLAKVRVLVQESLNLDVAQCAKLEAAVLREAGDRTPRSLRRRVRREVEKLDADAVRKRREAAREERSLYLKDEPDGMATLCLYLPAEQARAIYATVNSRIPAQRGAGDDRLLGARRVDHIVDVLAEAFGIDLRAVADTASPVLTAEQIARLDRGANTYVPSPAMKAAVRARPALPLPRLPTPRGPVRH